MRGVGWVKGHASLEWEPYNQETLSTEAKDNQYLGNGEGGRGGNVEVRNGQEKEGG